MTGIEEGIAIASLVASAAGTAATVVGGISSANAAAKTANYQAAVAANNEAIARQNARYSVQAGEAKAQTQAMKDRAMLGKIRVAGAANGLDVNSDSPLDVQVSQHGAGLEDEATIRHNAFLQAYGYNTQASNFDAEAGLDRSKASNATAALPFTVGSSLLNGASSVGTKWTQFQQAGALGSNNSDSDPSIT